MVWTVAWCVLPGTHGDADVLVEKDAYDTTTMNTTYTEDHHFRFRHCVEVGGRGGHAAPRGDG